MDITAKLKGIVSYCLNVDEDEIKNDSSFIDDLGADSIAVVDIIMSIEDEFGITIPDTEVENITTFKDAANYIEANL